MILAEITETGRKTANAFRPIVHQHQKQWLEVLDETEQRQLIVSLHGLQERSQDSESSILLLIYMHEEAEIVAFLLFAIVNKV